jgi:hypothetical protein
MGVQASQPTSPSPRKRGSPPSPPAKAGGEGLSRGRGKSCFQFTPQRFTVCNRPPSKSVSITVHALKSSKVAKLRSKVSPEEWQARVDLAAAYRLIDLYRMSDLIANRISIRVPGEHDEATDKNYQPHVRRPFGVLDWPALLRKLDRIDPGFRD